MDNPRDIIAEIRTLTNEYLNSNDCNFHVRVINRIQVLTRERLSNDSDNRWRSDTPESPPKISAGFQRSHI